MTYCRDGLRSTQIAPRFLIYLTTGRVENIWLYMAGMVSCRLFELSIFLSDNSETLKH
jgi:hypothetical protein